MIGPRGAIPEGPASKNVGVRDLPVPHMTRASKHQVGDPPGSNSVADIVNPLKKAISSAYQTAKDAVSGMTPEPKKPTAKEHASKQTEESRRRYERNPKRADKIIEGD